MDKIEGSLLFFVPCFFIGSRFASFPFAGETIKGVRMLDLVIRGGKVVTPYAVGEMDIGIQGEKIAALGQPGTLATDANRVIDAQGKVVIPGGIEPHAHIGVPVPPAWTGQADVMTQPPEAASRAAAFGGVTTFIDFTGDLSRKACWARVGVRCSKPLNGDVKYFALIVILIIRSTISWPDRFGPK